MSSMVDFIRGLEKQNLFSEEIIERVLKEWQALGYRHLKGTVTGRLPAPVCYGDRSRWCAFGAADGPPHSVWENV